MLLVCACCSCFRFAPGAHRNGINAGDSWLVVLVVFENSSEQDSFLDFFALSEKTTFRIATNYWSV